MFDYLVFIWFFFFFGIYIFIFCVSTEDKGVKVEAELGAPPTLMHFDPLMQM